MSIVNSRPSENVAILDKLAPQSLSTGVTTGTYVNVQGFHQVRATLLVGAMSTTGSTGATVDYSLLQATSSTGAGSKAITSAAITQFTNPTTSSNNVNNEAIIEIRTDGLDVANGFCYVAHKITVSNSPALVSALVEGYSPRFAPASAFNDTSVAQVVTV